ncbi:MAG: hypothetical protein Q4C14_08875, partial [Bacillota bacterium]|nr:hypothetical protein [Bacillota bacterium]
VKARWTLFMLYWHEKKIARGASRTIIPMFVYPNLLQLLITVDISFYTGHIPSCSTVARAFYQGDTCMRVGSYHQHMQSTTCFLAGTSLKQS